MITEMMAVTKYRPLLFQRVCSCPEDRAGQICSKRWQPHLYIWCTIFLSDLGRDSRSKAFYTHGLYAVLWFRESIDSPLKPVGKLGETGKPAPFKDSLLLLPPDMIWFVYNITKHAFWLCSCTMSATVHITVGWNKGSLLCLLHQYLDIVLD